MPMQLSRRAFNRGGAAVAAAAFLRGGSGAFAESAGEAPEPVVLARATSVVLAARETHVVLTPVPPPRRPPPKPRPKTKGEKPAPPRMQLVLRDVVARAGTDAYEVFLVLEGPNVFEATATRIQVGTLEQSRNKSDGDDAKGIDTKEKETRETDAKENTVKRDSVTFDANEAFAQFAKIRGFNIRHLRVVLVRRDVKDEQGKDTVPRDPTPPEIGAVELVRS